MPSAAPAGPTFSSRVHNRLHGGRKGAQMFHRAHVVLAVALAGALADDWLRKQQQARLLHPGLESRELRRNARKGRSDAVEPEHDRYRREEGRNEYPGTRVSRKRRIRASDQRREELRLGVGGVVEGRYERSQLLDALTCCIRRAGADRSREARDERSPGSHELEMRMIRAWSPRPCRRPACIGQGVRIPTKGEVT